MARNKKRFSVPYVSKTNKRFEIELTSQKRDVKAVTGYVDILCKNGIPVVDPLGRYLAQLGNPLPPFTHYKVREV